MGVEQAAPAALLDRTVGHGTGPATKAKRPMGRIGRWRTRAQIRGAMGCYSALLRLFAAIGPRPRPIPAEGADVLITGTFHSDNWVRSHVRPLAQSRACRRLRIVATSPVPAVDKVEAVYPPAWLVRWAGAVPARLAVFAWLSVRTRPDVIGAFHLLVNGLVSILLAKIAGARSLYFCVGGPVEVLDGGVHGENRYFARIKTPDPVIERRLTDAVASCDLVVTMGTRAMTFFRERGVTSAIHVISGGIDAKTFSGAEAGTAKAAEPDARDVKYDAILVGRLVPIKRIDIFIRAVADVARLRPETTAVIVGDGPLQEPLMALAKQLGVADRITFAGHQANVEQWLRQSRVFMLTSESEGLALSLMEAMTCGLPSVVPHVGDLGDLVEDGVNGFLVAEREPDAFARPLARLLTEPSTRDAFSAAARCAAGRYETGETVRRWDEVLRFSPPREGIADRPRSGTRSALSRKNLWTVMPAPTRRLVGSALSVFPQEQVLGRRFRQARAFVLDAQWWPPERAREYQLQRLRQLCSNAFEHSAFYRHRFTSAGFHPQDLKSLDDLLALPMLTRDDVRAHLEEMLVVSRRSRRIDAVSTGGTSGMPLHFYIGSNRSDIEYAYLTAAWERTSYRLGGTLAVLKGDVVGIEGGRLRHEYDPLLRRHLYSSFHLDDASLKRTLAHISTIGPCHLLAYPSVIAAMTRYLRRTSIDAPSNVRGIIAESEIVYPEQRAAAEQAFGCRYFSAYGLTEKVVAAAECEGTTHYHVWRTYGVFELIDEHGRPVTTPGQRGEIVGTSFINTVMPFIRYRTGDHATYVGHGCTACGRPHALIADICGHRTQESLVAQDGSAIPWSALNMHDNTFLNVVRFQFLQDTPGQATLRVMPGPVFSNVDRARLLRNLGRKLDGRITVSLQVVDALPLSDRGKVIYVDQRIAGTGDNSSHYIA